MKPIVKNNPQSENEWSEIIDSIFSGPSDKESGVVPEPAVSVKTLNDSPLEIEPSPFETTEFDFTPLDNPSLVDTLPERPVSNEPDPFIASVPLALLSDNDSQQTLASPVADASEQIKKTEKVPIVKGIICFDQTNSRKKTVLYAAGVLFLVIIAAYYLLSDKNSPPHISQKAATTVTLEKQAPAKTASTPLPTPVVKPSIEKTQRPVNKSNPLPTFIPVNGRDSSFRPKEPGWERYLDKLYEYRLYRNEGKIKSIQVLATKEKAISQIAIRNILKELTSSVDYTMLPSQEKQAGFMVSQGSVGKKADLLFYKKNGAIRAFVILLK